MSEEATTLSAVEGIKTESNYLRGRIAEELVDGNPHLGKDTIQLIKFHGSYEQDDRDRRSEAKKNKVPGGKYYSYMIRIAMPGGRINSEQMIAQLDLCDEVGNSTLRVTTRQGIQLHGVLKGDLKKVIRRINEVGLTTIAACGDVRRNVMCSPAPYKGDPVYDQLQAASELIAQETMPRTTAYHEIWLTDENGQKTLAGGGEPKDHEPLYGATYLPRKFKIGVALPGDNSADVYSQDVGLLAVCENQQVVGYNFVVGGGFGVTPSAAKTFAAVALPLGYVPADQAIEVIKAIMRVQRDFGNRSDRKVARMKYVINDWGIDRFKQKVEEYLGDPIADSKPMPVTNHNDAMGWHEQGDSLLFYGLNVENGRIKDEGDFRLKTALREVCTTLAPPMRMTPHQGIIFCDIKPSDKDKLESIFRSHGVPLSEDISTVRRWSIACPALPLCGLAVTESERILPSMIGELEKELEALGLGEERFTTRMTGCPNGCARPYNSDIGLVGKTKGKYTVFLGGRVQGDRLNWIYKDLVPAEDVVSTLKPVLKHFKESRQEGEAFGDFCHRIGQEGLLAACDA
jgi:sulfite reductase (ferredoxin)